MAFWTTSESAPKRKFRFGVEFTGFSNANIWWAKSVTKPNFEIGAAEHKYLNHTFWFPGNVTWGDVTLTFVDPAGGTEGVDAMGELLEIIAAYKYELPTTSFASDAATPPTISKANAVAATQKVVISQVNSEGVAVEKWTLHNAWVSKVDGGELSYGEEGLSEIAVTLKYDWASCDTSDGKSFLPLK